MPKTGSDSPWQLPPSKWIERAWHKKSIPKPRWSLRAKPDTGDYSRLQETKQRNGSLCMEINGSQKIYDSQRFMSISILLRIDVSTCHMDPHGKTRWFKNDHFSDLSLHAMPSVASFATSSKSSINFSGTSMEVLDTGRKAASAKKNTTGPVATRCYKLKQVGKRLGSKVCIFFPNGWVNV